MRALWGDVRPGDMWVFDPGQGPVSATLVLGTSVLDAEGHDTRVTVLYVSADGSLKVRTFDTFAHTRIPDDGSRFKEFTGP